MKLQQKYILCICLLPCFAEAKIVEKTLAEVEGQMISLLDTKEAQKRWRQGFMQGSSLESLFKKTGLRTQKQALDYLIKQTLLDTAAESLSIPISPKQIKQELNRRRKKRNLSKKAFSHLLVRNHFTSATYKNFLKKYLLRRMLVQREIGEKIRISDKQLNEYAIKTQKKPLFKSFKYDLGLLFFPPSKKGKKEAHKVFKQINQNATYFNRYKISIKGAKKSKLIAQKLNSLHPKIRSSIKALSVGQYSQVIFIPKLGYHIFTVLWKTPIIQNHRRQQKLSKQLFQKLFQQELKAWLERKRSIAAVHIK